MPRYDDQVKQLLKKPSEIVFDTIRQSELIELKLYIDEPAEENDFGFLITAYVDIPQTLWSKDTGTYSTKITKKLEVQIFTTPEVGNYLVVFASNILVKEFVNSVTKILNTVEWFKPVLIDTDRKEEEIRNELGDFRRVYVKDMDDDLVKTATMGGLRLELSSDYARYIRDYGGRLSAVSLIYEGNWMMITFRGIFYSPSKDAESRKVEIIHNLLKLLKEIDALDTSS